MKIEELSIEIKETVKFQQELFQIIEEFEMREMQEDLIKYAKMICKNTIERKILKIQETYLKKKLKKIILNRIKSELWFII